jgi:uncharacterized protein (TIGR02231 family)
MNQDRPRQRREARGPRVQLRPFEPGHLPLAQPWFADADTRRWLGGPDWLSEMLDLAGRPLSEFRGAAETGRYRWLAWDEGAAVGYIDCGTCDRWTTWEGGPAGRGVTHAIAVPCGSIAYVVDPARRRRGYATAMITAVTAMPELAGIELFAAGIEPENTASAGCLRKAGFQPLNPEPDWEGIVYYALFRGHATPPGSQLPDCSGRLRLGDGGRAQRREATRMAQEASAGKTPTGGFPVVRDPADAAAPAGGPDLPITAVTVFRDGARVTRTGTVDLPAGLGRVEVCALPQAADPTSVRVAVRGAGVALLEVEVNRRFRTDPIREDTTRLREDAVRLRDALKELEDEDTAQEAGLGFLGHLSEAAAASLARAVGAGRADYAELSRMSGHLTDGTQGVLARRRQIAARMRTARQEAEAAQARLSYVERQQARAVSYSQVAAVVEAGAASTVTVELSYHVSNASWEPLYDLALHGERLTVSYLAEVTQHTGEDWPQTTLALSTARQGQHQGLPELRPWYISRQVPLPPPFTRAPAGAQPVYARAMAPGPGETTLGGGEIPPFAAAAMAAGAAPQAADLTAEVSQGGEAGAGITYTVARPVEVPADGNPHKTTVAAFEADAALDYLTVPVLAAEAYLRATVTNGSLLLLPGAARVFHGSQFVGTTALETVAAGEEFEVQLGVDDQIRVERKLRRRSTSKALVGGTRTIDIAYEITVENHRDGKAKVSVHDHIPVSRDGDIKVRAREASPAPAGLDDLGEITWDLTLDGGKSAVIKHRFTVEHPASVQVAGV